MRATAIALSSWLIGVLVYPLSCLLIYRQGVSAGDYYAAAMTSLFSYSTAFLLIYLPVFTVIDRRTSATARRLIFWIASVLLSVIPTSLVIFSFGGVDWRALLSHEALLFHCFFVASSLVAGSLFASSWLRHPSPAST
jgi:hypothetical protein